MKKLLARKFFAGILIICLGVPTLGASVKEHKDAEKVYVKENIHWADSYVEYLKNQYPVQSLFENKNLDQVPEKEEVKKMIVSILDEKFSKELKTVTREEIISTLMRIWAEKTNQKINEIVIPMIAVYEDHDTIDPKYRTDIMIAYFQEIAKGKGNNLFAPKENMTYGEMAVVLRRIEQQIKEYKEFTNGGIAKGYFEIRVEPKVKEDKVQFEFELFSHYTKEQKIMFLSGHQFDLIILDEEGKEIYNYAEDRFFTQAIILKGIKPGGGLKWKDTWDLKNKEGNKITEGNFKAIISIKALGENFDIPEKELVKEIEFSLSQK